jgi:DNA-binding transcriptional regulator YhcF (GntR family)
MADGYCLAYRKSWSHPVFKDLREAAIWNFLYQNAFWQDGIRQFNGHTFELKRGQIVVSVSFLAKGFGMTDKGVRVVIQKLEKQGMLGKQRASKGTIITICNYNKYQSNEKTEGEQEGDVRAIKGQSKGNNKKQPNKLNKHNEVIKSVKGSRLPNDWIATDDYINFALSEGYTIDTANREAEKFKDYWIASTAKTAVKKDWLATWRNWIRNNKDKNYARTNKTKSATENFIEGFSGRNIEDFGNF